MDGLGPACGLDVIAGQKILDGNGAAYGLQQRAAREGGSRFLEDGIGRGGAGYGLDRKVRRKRGGLVFAHE